jgi:hypothetical protein
MIRNIPCCIALAKVAKASRAIIAIRDILGLAFMPSDRLVITLIIYFNRHYLKSNYKLIIIINEGLR